MNELFADPEGSGRPAGEDTPLAERMRPTRLSGFVGQQAILGPDSAIAAALASGQLPSLILWGPPGCGKTTLAACLAREAGATFLPFSAVRVGVKELRAVMGDAARLRKAGGRAPILFLDEIHRFNKAQQDALLPAVECGDVVLIGATTENPSFEVNAALLSRCRLLVLESLAEEDLLKLLRRALKDENGLADTAVKIEAGALESLVARCGGDARFALGALESCVQSAQHDDGLLDAKTVQAVLAQTHLIYDKSGEEHFNLISALHKSLRNSDAQAGIYWLVRMLESGEDPLYVARRLVRFASEDIGLADPAALLQANAATEAVHRLGLPEGSLALAQATVYLAQAPKSNALYLAEKEVRKSLRDGARPPVPAHLRNAPTRLMSELGYGQGYAYAHDDPDGVAEMSCLPDELSDRIFYRPTGRGFEAEAAERLRDAWRKAHARERPTGEG